LFGSFAFVVFVITDCLCLDAEVIKQDAGPPRVFAGHKVDFPQNAQRALSNVFQIADWRSDDIESTSHVGRGIVALRARRTKAPRAREEAAGPSSGDLDSLRHPARLSKAYSDHMHQPGDEDSI